jgi:hypothetical protein
LKEYFKAAWKECGGSQEQTSTSSLRMDNAEPISSITEREDNIRMTANLREEDVLPSLPGIENKKRTFMNKEKDKKNEQILLSSSSSSFKKDRENNLHSGKKVVLKLDDPSRQAALELAGKRARQGQVLVTNTSADRSNLNAQSQLDGSQIDSQIDCDNNTGDNDDNNHNDNDDNKNKDNNDNNDDGDNNGGDDDDGEGSREEEVEKREEEVEVENEVEKEGNGQEIVDGSHQRDFNADNDDINDGRGDMDNDDIDGNRNNDGSNVDDDHLEGRNGNDGDGIISTGRGDMINDVSLGRPTIPPLNSSSLPSVPVPSSHFYSPNPNPNPNPIPAHHFNGVEAPYLRTYGGTNTVEAPSVGVNIFENPGLGGAPSFEGPGVGLGGAGVNDCEGSGEGISFSPTPLTPLMQMPPSSQEMPPPSQPPRSQTRKKGVELEKKAMSEGREADKEVERDNGEEDTEGEKEVEKEVEEDRGLNREADYDMVENECNSMKRVKVNKNQDVAGNNIVGSITSVVTGNSAVRTSSMCAVSTSSTLAIREDDDLELYILNGLINLTDALNRTANRKRKRDDLIENGEGEGEGMRIYAYLFICFSVDVCVLLIIYIYTNEEKEMI